MKDKITKLLIECKVDKATANDIAETIDESFGKLQTDNKTLQATIDEHATAISEVKAGHVKELKMVKENYRKILTKTKEEVITTLKEDYEPYKQKLTNKVKNFLKENINSFRTVIKESLKDDMYKGSDADKLQSIAEAVEPLFKGKVDLTTIKEESTALKSKLDEVSEASRKSELGLEQKDKELKSLLSENKKLKAALNKPLRESVQDVKVAKDEVVQDAHKTPDYDNSVINEMRYLAGE